MTNRRSLLAMLFASALMLLVAAPQAGAVWGDLDTGFAAPAGFSQQLPPGAGYGQLVAAAVQPDGKILVAGSGGADFAGRLPMIQRFLPDGTLDSSFGSGGTSLIPAPAGGAGLFITGFGLQSDGKIVAVAQAGFSGSVFRLTASGALDTSFNSPNGFASLGTDMPTDVLVHTDGDIFVGSMGISGDPVLRRFNSSGTEIVTFKNTSTTNLSSVAFASFEPVVLRQSGNDIVIATGSQPVSDEVFFVAKLDTTGALVISWGSGGMATVPFSTSARPNSMIVQPSGAIVLGGETRVMGDSAWTLARLNSGGALDPSFSGGGKQELNFTSGGDYLLGMSASAGGGIVAVGGVADATGNDEIGGVRMMTADGAPEGGFGPDGMRYLALPGSTTLSGVATQADAKVIAVGSQQTPSLPSETLPLTARFRDAAPPVISVKISSPSKSKVTAKKLKKFGGTAATSFGSVAKVEIALQKVDSKLLKKKKQCRWLSSNKAKFKKSKAVAKKCSKQRWLAATGTGNWSYKLKRKLPKGSYVLSVRATVPDGGANVQSTPKTKKFKVT